MKRAGTVALGVVLATADAAAAPPPDLAPVDLAIDGCVNVPQDVLRRLVGLELGPLLGARPPRHEILALSVFVECLGDGLSVRVENPSAGGAMTRGLDLRGVPSGAQARTMALALAEIVASSRTEMGETPRHGDQPSVPTPQSQPPVELVPLALPELTKPQDPPPAPLPVMAQAAHREWRLLGHTSIRRFVIPGGAFLWGGGAGLEADFGDVLGGAVDVALEQGTSTVKLGEVDIVSASLSAIPFAARRGAHASGWVGLGGRIGMLRMSGRPTHPDQVNGLSSSGAWGGPVFVARGLIVTSARLTIGVGVEAGLPVLRRRGLVDGDRAVVADGPWVSAWVGMGISLPQ